MTDFLDDDRSPAAQPGPVVHDHASGSSHHLLMLLCCIPMVVIVVLLVTTGTATVGALLFPIACMLMMAVMMAFMMPRNH